MNSDDLTKVIDLIKDVKETIGQLPCTCIEYENSQMGIDMCDRCCCEADLGLVIKLLSEELNHERR